MPQQREALLFFCSFYWLCVLIFLSVCTMMASLQSCLQQLLSGRGFWELRKGDRSRSGSCVGGVVKRWQQHQQQMQFFYEPMVALPRSTDPQLSKVLKRSYGGCAGCPQRFVPAVASDAACGEQLLSFNYSNRDRRSENWKLGEDRDLVRQVIQL